MKKRTTGRQYRSYNYSSKFIFVTSGIYPPIFENTSPYAIRLNHVGMEMYIGSFHASVSTYSLVCHRQRSPKICLLFFYSGARVRCTSKVSKSQIRLVGWRPGRISHRKHRPGLLSKFQIHHHTAFVRKSSDPHLINRISSHYSRKFNFSWPQRLAVLESSIELRRLSYSQT